MKVKYTCPGCKRRDSVDVEPKINLKNLSLEKRLEIMKHILVHIVDNAIVSPEHLTLEIDLDINNIFDFLCVHYDIETVLTYCILFTVTDHGKMLQTRKDLLKMVADIRKRRDADNKREDQT